ncbi:unnamed protein product [Dibothriocephalus latus]|uniref:Uncharacterized protein n=1 Tax=Dibothriocephalus latus TaxID=60516 RepID=A0A3P7PEX4_DIBLA|nr:unnamed protein product [Dibothriocephalus latus]
MAEKDQITFRTAVPDDYRDGYIGKNAFWYDEDLGDCVLGSTAFLCPMDEVEGITVTDITVFNVTNVDSIYLNSSFPVTIHRIEEYVRDKKVEDRFIIEETMGLSQCPKYKQTRLVWKFPGTVAQRAAVSGSLLA